MSLQEEEGPIEQSIAGMLASSIPSNWTSALLEIEASQEPNGDQGFRHMITSPEGHRDLVTPPDEMYPETIRLYDLFAGAGKPWQHICFRITNLGTEEWEYHVDFEY